MTRLTPPARRPAAGGRRTSFARLPLVPIVGLVLVALATSAHAQQADRRDCRNTGRFDTWLADYRKEAAAKGVTQRTIRAVLDGMTLDQGIIRRDRGQRFFGQSFVSFAGKLASKNRIYTGGRKLKQRAGLFRDAERKYGVPGAVVTAFWALESDFGVGMGKLPVLRSLATLAYDCRRSELFREQLTSALKIIDRGDLRPEEMIGSWAGELGQTQFLPVHYLNHGVDGDGDGRVDLIRSDADVIMSTANYIKHLGWRAGEPWLEQVEVPTRMPWQEADTDIYHSRDKWHAWGVRTLGGRPLPAGRPEASLILPMGRLGPAFLAYRNFRIYTEWNNSLNYAVTAAYLATRLTGAPAMSKGRGGYEDLGYEQIKEMQRLLVRAGYDVGRVDGIHGNKSREAVKKVQLKFGLPADSYPTSELIERLRR
ncbi:MAG: lytic murein transglycosylase [Parvibaculaceae bacterium]